MMSAARQRQLMQGQTQIALKVLEATPIGGAWGVHQIRGELQRLSLAPGITTDVLQGCLRALIDAGLVKEQPAGQFSRMPVKEEARTTRALRSVPPAPPLEETMPTPETQKADKKTSTPIDLLSPIATRLREYADRLKDAQALAHAIADDIDNAAAELEERVTASAEEIQNLRQLKAILKMGSPE